MRLVKTTLFICSLICLCSSLAAIEPRKKVIVDTDCDMDDMMAILYLLKRPDIQIVAVTTTGTGMAHWKYTAPNILNLVDLAGHPNIPVAYGAKRSLRHYANFPKSWRKGIDQVYNIPLPKNPNSPVRIPSSALITKTLLESKEKITILCLAPLTNVAMALGNNPSIDQKVEHIVISGGSIATGGNIVGKQHGYHNTCAEYNIFLDAKAAEQVFRLGIPVTLVPLDATQEAPITKKFYQRLNQEKRNPSANFVYQVIKPYVESEKGVSLYFWDPVAAVVMTNPEIGTYQTLRLQVNQTTGPHYGCTMKDDKGAPISVCLSINAKSFYDLFYDTISSGN